MSWRRGADALLWLWRWLVVPTEMLTKEEHRPEKTPPVPTAAKKEDGRGCGAARPARTGCHWPHGSVRWLPCRAGCCRRGRGGHRRRDRCSRGGRASRPHPRLLRTGRSRTRRLQRSSRSIERIPELMAEQGIPGLAVTLMSSGLVDPGLRPARRRGFRSGERRRSSASSRCRSCSRRRW